MEAYKNLFAFNIKKVPIHLSSNYINYFKSKQFRHMLTPSSDIS